MSNEIPQVFTIFLNTTTRRSTINVMLERLIARGEVPQGAFAPIVKTIDQREELGSTGIGGGLAMPSCRNPMLSRISLTVALLMKPVDWQSLDAEPVDVVMLTLAPPSDMRQRLRTYDRLHSELRGDLLDRIRKSVCEEDLAELMGIVLNNP